MKYRLDPLSPTGLSPDEPRKKDVSGAFVSNGVDSISKAGEVQLKRNVTLSAGSNVTLTQSGQNIEIASTGGGGGGTGDVVGPASSTDNAITRFDGLTGKLIQNSTVTVSDTGDIATSGTVDGRDVSVDGARLDVITDADYKNSNTTKAQVGLGNVDNTSDLNKPISTATQTALDTKVDENAAIVAGTKTKITYDAKGLVTAGADATTADIADSTNRRYVTDADLVDIGNLSGTNTGDQTSIVGITGTTAQFNTALTDNDFATQAGTETLSNKTLTSPKVTAYDGIFTGSSKVFEFGSFGTPANYLGAETSTAGSAPTFYAAGSDTNIDIQFTPKGTGRAKIGAANVVTDTSTDTLTNKTLTTPTIASFINASHDHTNAAGGGQLTDAALSSAVSVSKGGTGATTHTSGNFLIGAGTAAVTSAKVAPTGTVVGTTDTQTLTNKTLTTPTIAQINNSTAPGVKLQLRTQTDNSNTIASATTAGVFVQYGWGQIIGNDTTSVTETITFPTAYTTVLGVMVSAGGASGSAPSPATSITDSTTEYGTTGALSIQWTDASTTGFRVTLGRTGANFSSANYYAYSWIAWGV